MYASMAKKPFTVKMRFTETEYLLFDEWYNSPNGCAKGVNSFAFPKIDRFDSTLAEYRFADGSAPQYVNPTGKFIDCTMQWEEV